MTRFAQHLQSNPKGTWLSQFIKTICSLSESAVTQALYSSMHFNILMNTLFESKPFHSQPLTCELQKVNVKRVLRPTRRVQNADLNSLSLREIVDEWTGFFFNRQLSFSSKPAGCDTQKKADKCEMTPGIHMNKQTVKQCSSYTQTNSSLTHTQSHQPPRCQTALSSPSKCGVRQYQPLSCTDTHIRH